MKILIPLPSKDFDPTEAAVSWKILKSHEIIFATPNGQKAIPDFIMLNGNGLGLFAPLLTADKNGKSAFSEMNESVEFNKPISYGQIETDNYDGLLLPGGHAPGMKEYLESNILQEKVSRFFDTSKAIGAICHGVVLAARSISSKTGKSVLYGRHVTALLKSSELLAWRLTRKNLGNYYRTYPEITVEDEVKNSLINNTYFHKGTPALIRDSLKRLWPGFIVVDNNLVTGRWPGDVHKFAGKFKEILESQ